MSDTPPPETPHNWAPPTPPPPAQVGWGRAVRLDPPPRAGAEATTRADVRFAAALTAALVLLGVLLGLIWAKWTPAGPAAQIFPGGGFLTDETTEGVIAGDGRYLVLVAPAGVLTALLVWTLVRFRGPLAMLALGVGGLLGSCAMQVVGGWTGGGSYTGRRFTVNGASYEVTRHLPLDVRASGLVFVWPALAALLYGMLAAFAARDDLGRPDPVRDSLVSVDPGGHPYGGGGDSDAAGALQQRDLPPQ